MIHAESKPVILLSALILSGCASVAEVDTDAQWEDLPRLLRPSVGSAASVSGQYFIVTGGVRADLSAGNDVQVLNLDRLEWSMAGPLAVPRFMHEQVTLNDGRVLIVGGRNFGSGEKFVPLDSCELLTNNGRTSTPTGALPEPMATPRVHTLPDGRIVAVGGATVAVYDPQQEKWSSAATLHESRVEHATVMIDDETLLVIGGIHRDTIERVDLQRGRSTLLSARLHGPTDDLAAVRMDDGRVWLIGGQHSDTGLTTDETWLLSLDADGDHAALKPGPDWPHSSGIADQRVIPTSRGYVLIGGESQTQYGDFEMSSVVLIDPALAKPTLAMMPPTSEPHDDAVAAWVDGWLIVAGGQVTNRSVTMLRLPLPVMKAERLRWPAD